MNLNKQEDRNKFQFIQCGKSSCGFIQNEYERIWLFNSSLESAVATCLKCGHDSFYYLNSSGRIVNTPKKIMAEEFEPTVRTGEKRKNNMIQSRIRALMTL